jgi:hypothetical protein
MILAKYENNQLHLQQAFLLPFYLSFHQNHTDTHV